MALSILKRTRALDTDAWSAWASTTDAPPYVDTPLVEYRVDSNTNITIDQLTAGSIATDAEGKSYWTGTGYFDVIMSAVNGNVKCEYESGRIVGVQYAEVYLSALQGALQTALGLLLQEKEAETKADINIEQKELLKRQQVLVERQTRGFDDDAKQKLLKQALDSWSVAYSVAQDANSIPDSIKVNVIDSIMKNAYTSLGITKTNDPIGEA